MGIRLRFTRHHDVHITQAKQTLRGDVSRGVQYRGSGLAGRFKRYRHRACRYDGRNGVFVHHLSHRVFQQDYVLIERFDLTLEFDTVYKVNRDGDVFLAQNVQERVL